MILFAKNIKEIFIKTGTIKKILCCYFWYPSLFRNIVPIRKAEDNRIFNIKWDKREPVEARKIEIFVYWILVIVLNILIIKIITIVGFLIPNDYSDILPEGLVNIYFIFVLSQQFGYTLRWDAKVSEDVSEIFWKGFAIALPFLLVIVAVIIQSFKINIEGTYKYQIIDKVGLGYLLIIVITLFYNTVILIGANTVNNFKKANYKEKRSLIITNSWYITLVMLALSFAIYVMVLSKTILPHYNLTSGYTIYFSILIGSITMFGIFLGLFSDHFCGKPLFYYVHEVSKNIYMLSGTIGFTSSIGIMCVFLPGMILLNSILQIDYKFFYSLSIIAVVLLIYSAALLLIYFYQLTYAIKNHLSDNKKSFYNMVSWFREILSDDVKNVNLELDSFAREHLIGKLVDLNSITREEIIDLFNNKDVFADFEKKNTLVLAILKFICTSKETFELEPLNTEKFEEGKIQLQRQKFKDILFFYATDLSEKEKKLILEKYDINLRTYNRI